MIIYIMRRVYILFFIFILAFLCLDAHERIMHWDSDVTIQEDASLHVVETLKVNCQGNEIRHGIVREFPTDYKDHAGFEYKVRFNLLESTMDGLPIGSRVEKFKNGLRIYLGDRSKAVSVGTHVFRIVYNTKRQLGFFDDHDELYWNVTGLGSNFPIDSVHVTVHMPPNVPNNKIILEGATGIYGEKKYDFRSNISPSGLVEYTTTRGFMPHEGLTIIISWPKGYVIETSLWWYFFIDNLFFIILLIGFFFLMIFFVYAYRTMRSRVKCGTIIPLFYPPDNVDPGALSYILEMGYSVKSFAANIVHMAVRGLITIDYVHGSFFKSASYVLKKRVDSSVAKTEFEEQFFKYCFNTHDSCTIDQNSRSCIVSANSALQKIYARLFDVSMFQSQGSYGFGGFVIIIVSVVCALLTNLHCYENVWFWVLLASHGILYGVALYILPYYTQQGQNFKESIVGFKMFLSVTETERLKIIGTPPTKTPELFEHYLPYAIALNVEEQWSKQFVPVFDSLMKAGVSYTPTWYHSSRPFSPLDLAFLSMGLSRSLNESMSTQDSNSISSSSNRPGSSSGSGGRGYSGGGGGGGGVGGW